MSVELKKAAYAGNVSGKFDNYAEWDYNSFVHGTEIYRSFRKNIAGWSSLEARRAHNPKVIGSNPIPATLKRLSPVWRSFLCDLHRKLC